jgi:cupin 2 domain-containing protein
MSENTTAGPVKKPKAKARRQSKLGGNIFAAVPTDLSDELVQTLIRASGIRIERIVSQGHTSPQGFWYDQATHEWILLLAGAARLQFEGKEPVEMEIGSFFNIPAHQRHRVDWTDPAQPTIWLAIHYSDSLSEER